MAKTVLRMIGNNGRNSRHLHGYCGAPRAVTRRKCYWRQFFLFFSVDLIRSIKKNISNGHHPLLHVTPPQHCHAETLNAQRKARTKHRPQRLCLHVRYCWWCVPWGDNCPKAKLLELNEKILFLVPYILSPIPYFTILIVLAYTLC